MDPGAVLRPVGPRPGRVYWTRRLIVLGIAVVVVVLLARACGGGTASNGAGPRPTPRPSATTSPTPGPVTDCRKADLQVTAGTDAATYPAGALPRLSALVRNVADQPCRFRTTPAQRVWTVVSGQDQVWTSADCTQSGSPAKARLRPARTIAYALVWNRHRSAKGCPAGTPEAAPGTYQLHVSVNGVAAATVVFHLTG
jgi:hypothetical protein